MKAGDVALARVQQADGQLKPRPVLILCQTPPFSDHLVCALSSKLRHEFPGFDEIIGQQDADFSASGLKVPSLIRLGMLATLPESAMLGRLGMVSNKRLARLKSRLANHLAEEIQT
jgi:mRNA interferase MazF